MCTGNGHQSQNPILVPASAAYSITSPTPICSTTSAEPSRTNCFQMYSRTGKTRHSPDERIVSRNRLA